MSVEHPFSRLTPDFIMDAVESVGYRCDARILELNSFENRVYQIGIEQAEPVIAKFYRPGRWSSEQIAEEHSFTCELADHGLSVVAPLAFDNRTCFHHEGFDVAVFPRRGGRAPPVDDPDCLKVLGRFIARLHNVGAAGSFRFRPRITLREYGSLAAEWLLANHFIPGELTATYRSITEPLLGLIAERFDRAECRTLRLHADCHMGNVLWRDGQPHLVDFDDARSGPAIQDLWMLLSGDEAAQATQMASVLEGYRDFRDFDTRELLLIEPLRTLRMMHHAAWLARRWDDPAFPRAFPFFNTTRYWSEHVLALKEQWSAVQAPALTLYD